MNCLQHTWRGTLLDLRPLRKPLTGGEGRKNAAVASSGNCVSSEQDNSAELLVRGLSPDALQQTELGFHGELAQPRPYSADAVAIRL